MCDTDNVYDSIKKMTPEAITGDPESTKSIDCWACKRPVPAHEITPGGRHDEDQGGCGCYIR